MKIIESWPIKGRVTIAHVDAFPEELKREQARAHLDAGAAVLPKNLGVSAEDREKLAARAPEHAYRLRLALLDGDDLVGWSEGWEDVSEPDTFFMAASLVLPAYRRQGLYAALADKTLELTKRDGFQSVSSKHVLTNNPILIAKLKAGFHVVGFELSERWGTMIKLVFHHNAMKTRALYHRAIGRDDPEIQAALKMP